MVRLGPVFERFTERARQVVVLAQGEARALRHNYIGTEHIVLGLFREEEGLAARVLESLDLTVEEVRAQVARIVGQGDELTTGQIPFTPRARKVLEAALSEAVALKHDYIGTEHLLLGLTHVKDGVAARILADFDADAEKIRSEIMRMLSQPGRVPRAKRTGDAATRASAAGRARDLTSLAFALEHAKETLIEQQQFELAARLRDKQRRLQLLTAEIEAELADLDPPLELPPSARGAEAARWQYEVKRLEGGSDSWADQLSEWRREGWELLTVLSEGDERYAVVERRI